MESFHYSRATFSLLSVAEFQLLRLSVETFCNRGEISSTAVYKTVVCLFVFPSICSVAGVRTLNCLNIDL